MSNLKKFMIVAKCRKICSNKAMLNGALFSIFSFVNRGISFVLLLILASYITPKEYGYLNLYSTVGMVLSYFIAMSTAGYTSIIFFREGKNGVAKTFSAVLLISTIMLLIFEIVLAIGHNFIPAILQLSLNILNIAIFVSFFNTFGQFWLDYYRLNENVKFCGVLTCGTALLNFFISIYLVKYLRMSWEGRVYAEFTMSLLLGGSSIIYFLKKGFFTRNIKSYLKNMLLWGIPLIPHMATTFIRQGCDRYIINAYHSIGDVGLFSFALNLSNIITMVGFGFNQSNSVDIFKTLSDNNLSKGEILQKVNRQKRTFLILYLVVAIAVFIVCFSILPIILPKYSSALKYFPLLALYGLLVCFYFVYTNFLFFYKKTKNLMYITFLSSVLHLFLSLCFTRYSLFITASLYVLTQFLVVIAVRRIANALLEKNLNVKKMSKC